MPLTLITGPANAAKAGVAFERLRALLAREPLLVVPTAADVEHYQRELSDAGLVFPAAVVTFDGLMRLVAERAGVRGRRLGALARERVLSAAIADVALERLAASAASPGFARSAGRLFAELQRELVAPERLMSALRRAGDELAAGRRAQAMEAAAVYAAYRDRLARLQAHDDEGLAWAALDALRRAPARWAERPVLFYGFDDLTAAQRDAVETLVRHAETEVLVTLPYEPGRAAFAGRATTVELLRPLAREHVVLPERSEHYSPHARPVLHHLERHLFEPAAPVAPAGPGLRLLEAGGERAEAELVAAEALELAASGVAWEDIAVLVPGGSPSGDLLAQVLESHGVPVARDRTLELGRTRLGAGLLAVARAAGPEGTAEDLLRWLRTPGCVPAPEPVDRLEAAVRRGRVASAASARRLWQGPAEVPARLEAVRAAVAQGPLALLDVLRDEVEAIWTAPHRRRAAVLAPEAAADARVAAAVHAAVAELRRLAAVDPDLLPGVAQALESLSALELHERDSGGGVLIADPKQIRARRFRAVFATGLQDGELPRRPAPDPFLDDDERRALARAGGLVLPLREDELASERYLFYSVCSRPRELLALSWRSSTEEGDPLLPSPFLEDVRALFGGELWAGRRRRLLAQVTWPLAEAPTALERRRARAAATTRPEPPALAPPASEPVLAALAARDREPARGLESFASCGVRWLVELLLRPRAIEPDPDPLRRGSLAHAVMELTLRQLRERTGSARLTPERLQAALEELERALAERERGARGARERAELRALGADLARGLRHECEHGAGLEPELLEWSFGSEGDEHGALELADGTRVVGRVDRVDRGPGTAIVRDYKHRTVHPAARWGPDRRLQAGLYALAVRELLGAEPLAALYQPLSGSDLRPRGIVRAGAGGDYVANDVLADEEFEAALAEVGALAADAARAIRAAQLVPCPSRCSTRGCLYPAICRARDFEVDSAAGGGGEAA